MDLPKLQLTGRLVLNVSGAEDFQLDTSAWIAVAEAIANEGSVAALQVAVTSVATIPNGRRLRSTSASGDGVRGLSQLGFASVSVDFTIDVHGQEEFQSVRRSLAEKTLPEVATSIRLQLEKLNVPHALGAVTSLETGPIPTVISTLALPPSAATPAASAASVATVASASSVASAGSAESTTSASSDHKTSGDALEARPSATGSGEEAVAATQEVATRAAAGNTTNELVDVQPLNDNHAGSGGDGISWEAKWGRAVQGNRRGAGASALTWAASALTAAALGTFVAAFAWRTRWGLTGARAGFEFLAGDVGEVEENEGHRFQGPEEMEPLTGAE